jgi:hypothetical protein
MAADSLGRWTSLASSTFSRSQDPVIRQATFGSFRCGPQRMCQLAKRSLWIQEGSPGWNPYYLAHSGGCNAIALFQLEA